MSGKGHIARQRTKSREAHAAKVAKAQEFGCSTYQSLSMKPEEVFEITLRRVAWLNDKIAWNQANGIKYGLYIRERESLLWLMDKVKELSQKLLDAGRE